MCLHFFNKSDFSNVLGNVSLTLSNLIFFVFMLAPVREIKQILRKMWLWDTATASKAQKAQKRGHHSHHSNHSHHSYQSPELP